MINTVQKKRPVFLVQPESWPEKYNPSLQQSIAVWNTQDIFKLFFFFLLHSVEIIPSIYTSVPLHCLS